MPASRIDMRKLKDALRLKFEGGQSHQQIASALGISKGVVTKYVGLAVAAALDWPSIAAMSDATLERRLLPSPRPSDSYAQADFGRIHQELARKGVTLITSQLPIEHWHEWIGDQTVADAMLDRLMQNHHRFTLTGESLRKKATPTKAKAD